MLRDSDDLRSAFKRLRRAPDQHARGRSFEELVELLFANHGYQVRRNPGAARPRQTDLHARRGTTEFIIETKWESTPSDIADLDGLRARLQRVPQHIVGVFFSMAGFTEEAARSVETDRQREIILFDGPEIDGLFEKHFNLRLLIERKRRILTRDGRVLMGRSPDLWEGEPRPNPDAFPRPDAEMWSPDHGVLPWVSGAGEFGPTVFPQALSLLTWDELVGPHVALDLRLPIESQADVEHTLDLLRRTIGITEAGCFTIQQAGTCWHGTGARSFLNAINGWQQRYAGIDLAALHHSEEATYFDMCAGGIYTLHFYLRVKPTWSIRFADLSARLIGTPMDPEPYRELAQVLGVSDHAYFRPHATAPGGGFWTLDRRRFPLLPVAYLRSGGLISGIVARNPFRSDDTLTALEPELASALKPLADFELLVCGLANYHGLNDVVDGYYLHSATTTRTHDVSLYCLTGDWDTYLIRNGRPYDAAAHGLASSCISAASVEL